MEENETFAIELANRVRRILTGNRYMSLATVQDGNVWVAPIAYVLDDGPVFYFYSAKDSLHAKHFAINPKVACCVFDSTRSSDDADGVQISATVTEVSSEDLERVMGIYFQRSFPDPVVRSRWLRPTEDFCNAAAQRFYRLLPTAVFVPDLSSLKIDLRLEVDVRLLGKSL